MEDVPALLLAIASAYAVAVSAGATIHQRGTMATFAITVAAPMVLAAPMLIPGNRVTFRATSMFVSTDLLFRLIDYYRTLRATADRPAFRDFCSFLVPFPVLLTVFRQRHREHARFAWVDVARVAFGAAGAATGFLLLEISAEIAVIRERFLLDHVVKAVAFLFTIESASLGLFGLERMAGFDAPPFVQRAFLSRTVSDFWMRYNTRIHRWLYENVFLPCGGRRAPVSGVVLVFFVSALLHEVAFDIALSRFDGYQFVFFMVQAPAVMASGYVERLANRGGWIGTTIAHTLTITWMIGSSVFFFHGVNAIFPFVYVSESWLP